VIQICVKHFYLFLIITPFLTARPYDRMTARLQDRKTA